MDSGKHTHNEVRTNSIHGIQGLTYRQNGTTSNVEDSEEIDNSEFCTDGKKPKSKVAQEFPTVTCPTSSRVVIENKNELKKSNLETNVKSAPSSEGNHPLHGEIHKDADESPFDSNKTLDVHPDHFSFFQAAHNAGENSEEAVKIQMAHCVTGTAVGNHAGELTGTKYPKDKNNTNSGEITTTCTTSGEPTERVEYDHENRTESCKRCQEKDFAIEQLHGLYTNVCKRSEKLSNSKQKQVKKKVTDKQKEMRKLVHGNGKTKEATEFHDSEHEKVQAALGEICILTDLFEKLTSMCKRSSPKGFFCGCQEKVKELQSVVEDKEQYIAVKENVCQALNEKCDGLEKEREQILKETERIRQERDDAIREKEEALTRLSSVASQKLHENNPGIMDLSDDNRPLNLAEKFSELYDNEWTDFYDELSDDGKDEKDIVADLLRIVKIIYEYCKNERGLQEENLARNFGIEEEKSTAEETDEQKSDRIQTEGVTRTAGQDENTRLQKRKIKRFLKSTRSFSLDVLRRKMKLEQILPGICNPITDVCKKYVDRCMRLCWLMQVQDKPIVLVFEIDRDQPFKIDVYRHFTKTGQLGDYLVWPPMFLHEGGPLLQKGVIQPK